MKITITQSLLLYLLYLALPCTGNAQTSVNVEVNDDAPKENILFASIPSGEESNFNWNGPPIRRDVGVSFRAKSDGLLEAITVHVRNATASTYSSPFTMKVFVTEKFTQIPTSGEELVSVEGVLPRVIEAENWLTFRLSDPLSLKEGKYYIILFSFEQGVQDSKQLGLYVGMGDDVNSQFWATADENDELLRNGSLKVLFYIHEKSTN